MRLSSKELNVRKVKTLLKNIQANKVSHNTVAAELNKRFDRMEQEDAPWFEDLYPKYRRLMTA
jgi:hypothetical protein